MTVWRVVVPIKQGDDGKSRLRGTMSRDARFCLAERMASHVLDVLQDCFDRRAITIISPELPDLWSGEWVRDEGRGLNAELTAWRAAQANAPVLIVHADLPLLSSADIDALLDAAGEGVALATDRQGRGTNALAIFDGRPFTMHFGANSSALHRAQYPGTAIVEREGLMADLDTPDDVTFMLSRGFVI